MKTHFIVLAVLLSGFQTQAQVPFVITVETTNPGASNDQSFTIPTFSGETYEYDIDVGNDGSYEISGVTGDFTIDFGTTGKQTIAIRGLFPRFYTGFDPNGSNYTGDKDKVTSIDQWGNIAWTSFGGAFAGCSNLAKVATADVPDLTLVTSLENMFYGNTNLPDISNIDMWDVSRITTMAGTFGLCNNFNGDVSSWQTGAVTDMSNMFNNCRVFNQNISGWDVSKVTNMYLMFGGARIFNQDLSPWKVDLVTNMQRMFINAWAFNGDVTTWTTSSCTDMSYMFSGATAFNQDISRWDVGAVGNMTSMFRNAGAFQQNIGLWNLTSLGQASRMLDDCGVGNLYDDILIGWSTKALKSGVALGADGLFYCTGEQARNQIIDKFNWTFNDDMRSCEEDVFLTTWKTDNPGASCTSCITITTPLFQKYDVDWDNDGVFDQLGLTGTVTYSFSTPGEYTIGIRGDFQMTNNTNQDREKLIRVDQWGSIKWANMNSMFSGCTSLVLAATDVPDLNQVISMQGMFANCTLLTAGVAGWDVSNVENMRGTFSFCNNFDEDLSSWNVGLVTDMSQMFQNCTSFNQNLSSWMVHNVTDMSQMFQNCTNFNQSLSSWMVHNVTDMSEMFDQASSFNQDLSMWDVSSVLDFLFMFGGAENFDQPLGSWDISSATNVVGMLNFSGLSTENYDETLIGWAQLSLQPGLTLGAYPLVYCDAESARQSIIDNFGWTIDDSGKDCSQDYPFITTWKTDNPGSSCSTCVTIPSAGALQSYDVDWNNDGIYDTTGVNQAITHDYGIAGIKTIAIRGRFPRIRFGATGTDKEKLLSIEQWGGIGWSSFQYAFGGCLNMVINANDAPDLGAVTSLEGMLSGCTLVDNDLRHWDFSTITDMTAFLSNTSLDVPTYDSLLISWAATSLQPNVTVGAFGLIFCHGTEARDLLINNLGWSFSGDERYCFNTRPCKETIVNMWVGPDFDGWSIDPDNWSLRTFPEACHAVVIPAGKTVVAPASGLQAQCFTLDVKPGGSLIVNGTLNVWVDEE